jgi:hypothetical protein
MTDSTLSKDLADLVNRIDSMPDGARTAILHGLLTAKAERQERVAVKLLTPMQCAAIDQRNLVLLKQVNAMCARHGYTLPSNERVNLKELDAALKASNTDLDSRFRIKGALASLNLI